MLIDISVVGLCKFENGNAKMKKLLFVTAGVFALGAAAPASAADLPARTYSKAPAVVAAAYDWSGFYIGVNGGGGFSHNCWDLGRLSGEVPRDAMMRPEEPSVASLATAGR